MKTLSLFLFFATALAATPIERVRLVDAGHPPKSDGSQYVGPYTLRIDGHDVPVLCIDYRDQTKPGEEWSAYVTNLQGDLRNTYHPNKLIQYEEAAYLFTLITEPGADRVAIQHAAWALFDGSYRTDKAAEQILAQAKREYTKVDWRRFAVVSQIATRGAREQEFIMQVSVPEPALVNLLGGLMAIGLALAGRRRR